MEKQPLTAEGYEQLEQELKHLKSVERPNVIQAIAEAREQGDLSENAEYDAAKERQSFIVARAQVIDPSQMNGDTVRFGATVTLADADTDEESTYRIVGELESDAKQGKLSLTAPLAKALISKTEGDVVEVTTPGGARSYEIVEVQYG